MDAGLEAALLDVLERSAGGRPVDEAWLRATYPSHWRAIRDFLSFEARAAGGAPVGESAGPYRLVRRLGRGGAGTVYLSRLPADAHGLPAGTHVAVKVIHPELSRRRGFVDRVLAEARAAASFDHANVVRTLDAGIAQAERGPLVYV